MFWASVFCIDLLFEVLIKTKNELESFLLFECKVCSIANGVIIGARQVAISIKTEESSAVITVLL